jgi:thiamine biosynthesis protein ThiS
MEIKLTVNGLEHSQPGGITGGGLLAALNIPPGAIVAELNGGVIRREEFLNTTLADGDVIELVTLVGGG